MIIIKAVRNRGGFMCRCVSDNIGFEDDFLIKQFKSFTPRKGKDHTLQLDCSLIELQELCGLLENYTLDVCTHKLQLFPETYYYDLDSDESGYAEGCILCLIPGTESSLQDVPEMVSEILKYEFGGEDYKFLVSIDYLINFFKSLNLNFKNLHD